MNLILKFGDEELRREFERRLRAAHPEVLASYVAAKTRPHAVLENLDEAQAGWVRESVTDLGKVYDDVQFEPFRPGR